MGNKLKFAIIGLLGFSTACSTAKKSQKSEENLTPDQPTATEVVPTIQVMYGVRRPDPARAIEIPEKETPEAQSNEAPATDTENDTQQ